MEGGEQAGAPSASASFVSFWMKSPAGQYVSGFRELSGMQASLVKMSQPIGDWSNPPNNDLVLSLALRPCRGTVRVAGELLPSHQPLDTLGFVPPGCDARMTLDTASEFLVLAIDGQAAAEAMSEEIARSKLLQRQGGMFKDEGAAQLLRTLWHVINTQEGRAESLYADSAVAVLLGTLSGWQRLNQGDRYGGLSPVALRRAREMLDAAVSGEIIDLAALARVTGLSPHHFCRAFRQSTGVPPHRWLINRRIERACELLLAGDMPIAFVALAVGYDDPAYFSRLFRRETGLSPAKWRKERLS